MTDSSEKVAHDTVMAMAEQINDLCAEIKRRRESEQFAWKNANTIEEARQSLMKRLDAANATIERLNAQLDQLEDNNGIRQ